MSQTPVNVKLALPQKPGFGSRSGVVQVLQTGPNIGGQTIIQQRSPSFKSFTTVRPYIPAANVQMNTNTAIQYVRKPEMTELHVSIKRVNIQREQEVDVYSALVINPTGGFVAPQLTQSFTPYGNPLMTLNPNVIQPISSHGISAGSVPGLGTSGSVLSSLANSRKPCNCTKSHCLKLYCECFAQGQLCQNCNCNNCMNNLAYEEERGRAIKMTLERNPTAFHPKIGRGEGERKHTKGCNCKRSGCLKNYCECYEAKISCSDLCRCQGCRNTEDSVERRSLMRLAAMGSLRSRQPASFKKHLIKPPSDT
ncbi:Protein lin-54 [Fasciolopsis buskii]|uniref:Protein lin-54 n=1 Tax=Fasciolopsis buskii TaxID=27845 RepID=A0A8E0RTE3_9TREM|nr:Protein lin-54 [Fasciolopsis buski]